MDNIMKLSYAEVKEKNLDLNDITILDSLQLDHNSYKEGLLKSIIFTAIAITVFLSL